MVPQQRFVERTLRLDRPDHAVVQQVVERSQSRRTADRMAAEGRDMSQHGVVLQGIHHLVARHEGPERHPSAEGLRQADDVGHDAVLLHRKHLARPAQTGLDLIEDQQRTRFVAPLPERFEVARLRRTHPRLALHRLGQHARRAARDAVQLREIVELDRLHVGQQRTERPLPLLALRSPHHAHRTVRRTVVGPPHGDHPGAPGEAFGQFQRPLDRLGPRIDEIDAFERRRQQRGDLRRIGHLRRLDQLAVDHHVHVARRLLLNGPHHRRIRMPDVAHRNTRHQVVVTFPFGRIEKRALAPGNLHQHGRRRSLGHMGQKLFSQDRIHGFFCFRIYSRPPKRRCRIASASFTLRRIQRSISSACSASVIRHPSTVRRTRSESW